MASAAVFGGRAASPAMTSAVGVALIGVHGGSGASTLARLLGADGTGLVMEWQEGMPHPGNRLGVLVARSTAQGLTAAAGWVTGWRAHLPRPVLMVVADVPFRDPPVVRYRVRALSSQVSAVVRVPYLYPLRHLDDPVDALTNRNVAVAVKALRLHLADLCTLVSGGP